MKRFAPRRYFDAARLAAYIADSRLWGIADAFHGFAAKFGGAPGEQRTPKFVSSRRSARERWLVRPGAQRDWR
jgi:hypothetical protein